MTWLPILLLTTSLHADPGGIPNHGCSAPHGQACPKKNHKGTSTGNGGSGASKHSGRWVYQQHAGQDVRILWIGGYIQPNLYDDTMIWREEQTENRRKAKVKEEKHRKELQEKDRTAREKAEQARYTRDQEARRRLELENQAKERAAEARKEKEKAAKERLEAEKRRKKDGK